MIQKSDTILITGATGLVGSYVVRRLWKDGYHNIRAIKRSTSKLDLLGDLSDKITWCEADVTDVLSIDSYMEGVDIVIHTAAVVSYDPKKRELMNDINVNGTANMVNLALDHNVKRFIHLSSVAALGKSENGTIRNEKTEWDHSINTTDYAISKYNSEKEVWRGFAEGLSVIILNPSFILGAAYWAETSTAIWSKMDKGIPYYPLGTNGYVNVLDVAKVVQIAMESDINGERFVISAETISYQNFFTSVANAIKAKVPSKALTPTLRAFAWRLDWIRSKLTGSSQILTSASAESTAQMTEYDNQKSVEVLRMEYMDIKSTIDEIGELYLESKAKGADFAIIK